MTALLLPPRATPTRLQAPMLRTLPEAVAENVQRVRSRTAVPIMAVVKADGYGHGAAGPSKRAPRGWGSPMSRRASRSAMPDSRCRS